MYPNNSEEDEIWDMSLFPNGLTVEKDRKLAEIVMSIVHAIQEYSHYVTRLSKGDKEFFDGYVMFTEEESYMNAFFAADQITMERDNTTTFISKLLCMCFMYSHFCRNGERMKNYAIQNVKEKQDDDKLISDDNFIMADALDLLNTLHSFFRMHISSYLKKVVDFLLKEGMIAGVDEKRLYEFVANLFYLLDPNHLSFYVLYHEEMEYISVGFKPEMKVFGKLEYLTPVVYTVSCP